MSTIPRNTLNIAEDFVICNACGTQYPLTSDAEKNSCKICDDPRQYVPPEGQTFTTLRQLRQKGHRNVWWQDEQQQSIWSVMTDPSFAIGERAMLIQTRQGNILWDLIPFLDQDTVEKIVDLGGLKAIVISHPHYYSTWAEWSRTFGCPVYVGKPDEEWLERTDTEGAEIRFLSETYTAILDGATAIVAGGHFPGSLLLHWQRNLFIADTILPVPSATNPVPGKEGVISFTFFWSIPNRIPLHPDEILMIWRKVKHLEFDSAFGAFRGMDVRTMENELQRNTGGVKGRLLESCKIYVKAMGWQNHAVLFEQL
ncbi:hypothetical protein K431DRAFT_281759 [Polychaeton citri CBS 116435]|uniref:Metallo-beta-lactamase domain-containing protein n=1 Tax=Polychaeton citri CBS 116435 TaxID=1314669 RepID=A0A9P4QH61_9PEZI|nr:hypothetical protein K431DRAFT_281759 [Polychaeton citri CBS 116435]